MSIKIDLKIIFFLLLFCITSQLEIYLLLMLFAFIHELGHLIAGLILKFRPQEFKITPVGMTIKFKQPQDIQNSKVKKGNTQCIKRAIVASAGPITNFLIITILLNINIPLEYKMPIIFSNFLIGIFNLIPIYPLDGGRIIKEILHIFVGFTKAYKYTHIISKASIIILTVVSSIAILYIHNISIIIILAYLWAIMLSETRRYNKKYIAFSKTSKS